MLWKAGEPRARKIQQRFPTTSHFPSTRATGAVILHTRERDNSSNHPSKGTDEAGAAVSRSDQRQSSNPVAAPAALGSHTMQGGRHSKVVHPIASGRAHPLRLGSPREADVLSRTRAAPSEKALAG